MEDKIKKSLSAFSKALKGMTPEEKEYWKEEFRDKNPKGWVSVEDALPMWKAMDVGKGYSEYKVKDTNGDEFPTQVTDHTGWYYMYAKERGITHWWND